MAKKDIKEKTILNNIKVRKPNLVKWISNEALDGKTSPLTLSPEHYQFLKDQTDALGGIDALLSMGEAEEVLGMGLSNVIDKGIETYALPEKKYEYLEYSSGRVKFKETENPKETGIYKYRLPKTSKFPDGKVTRVKVVKKKAVDELNDLLSSRQELDKMRKKREDKGYCPILFYRSQKEGSRAAKGVAVYIERSPGIPESVDDKTHDSYEFGKISDTDNHTRTGIDRIKIARFESEGIYYNVLIAHVFNPNSFREEKYIDNSYVIKVNQKDEKNIVNLIADEITAERRSSPLKEKPPWFDKLIKAYKPHRKLYR